jgi:hypothetical protein
MDKTVIIVSAVLGSLGVLSAILGFSAEGTKLNVSSLCILHAYTDRFVSRLIFSVFYSWIFLLNSYTAPSWCLAGALH